MKAIIIKFDEHEEGLESQALIEIARMIDEGYTSGMGSPVDWHIENELENYKYG